MKTIIFENTHHVKQVCSVCGYTHEFKNGAKRTIILDNENYGDKPFIYLSSSNATADDVPLYVSMYACPRCFTVQLNDTCYEEELI